MGRSGIVASGPGVDVAVPILEQKRSLEDVWSERLIRFWRVWSWGTKCVRGKAKFTVQEQWIMCVILSPSSVARLRFGVDRSSEMGTIFGDEDRVGKPRDERVLERREWGVCGGWERMGQIIWVMWGRETSWLRM